jgi:hypothetical protein
VSILVLPVVFDEVFLQKEKDDLVYVELETEKEEVREKIAALYLASNLLDKSNLIDLPLYCHCHLICSLLLCRLLLSTFDS